MSQNTITNGTINATLEAFIIPNKANMVSDWLIESMQKQMIERNNAVAAQTGYEFNPETDKLVQLWYVGMNSENLSDHGCVVEDETGTKYALRPNNIERLPAKLFEGHKEGDVIELAFPVTCHRRNADDVSVVVNAKVRLNQCDYRYRRFGKFEEVLQQVTA